jgi:hypothetical protein
MTMKVVKSVKTFFKKIKLVFTSDIVEDVSYLNMLKHNLEGKAFRGMSGHLCVIREGNLYYSIDNGANWDKANDWSAMKDGKGKTHVLYSYKEKKYSSFNLKYVREE